MSTARRRGIVERIREEGRQAALAGRNPQTNPYIAQNSMDRYQWNNGYMAGAREIQAAEDDVEQRRNEEIDALLQAHRKNEGIA